LVGRSAFQFSVPRSQFSVAIRALKNWIVILSEAKDLLSFTAAVPLYFAKAPPNKRIVILSEAKDLLSFAAAAPLYFAIAIPFFSASIADLIA